MQLLMYVINFDRCSGPIFYVQDFEGLVPKMMVDRTTRSWSKFNINVIFHNKSLISRVEAHMKWLVPKLAWLHLTRLNSNVEWICRLVNKSCRENCRYIVATCLFTRSSTSITGQQCRQMTGFHWKTSHTEVTARATMNSSQVTCEQVI